MFNHLPSLETVRPLPSLALVSLIGTLAVTACSSDDASDGTSPGAGATTTGGTAAGGVANGGTGATMAGGEGGTAGGDGNTGGSGGESLAPAGSPVALHGQLHVSGAQLLDESDTPTQLRGAAYGWDNWWPQFYNADTVSWLKTDWCVDVVRPAMGIEPAGAYLDNPAASKARIQTVVDAAIAEGVYVIIDWHAHDPHEAEAIAFFTEMAQLYGDQPNVIYEIFNEPDDDETWPQVKAYSENVIAAIRTHDPDNPIIVGSPEWDQRIDLVAADPITTDDNLLYSVHFYANTHGAWLRSRTEAAIMAGIPVIVSESSGSEASGMGDNNYPEWESWFSFMEDHNISWLNYAIADKAGETISVLEPGSPATGGWTDDHLTESGEYIRGVLRGACTR